MPVASPFEVAAARFRDEPDAWLPLPARPRGAAWTVTLLAGPAARDVSCLVGPAWSVSGAVWRSFVWRPEAERGDAVAIKRALPAFAGELGVRPSADGAEVVLRGTYEPPLGWVGALADAAALRLVAQQTVERIAGDVASRLVRP